MTLTPDFIRSQFPALTDPITSRTAFFENAGGSYPCAQVVDRLTRFYRERKVQPYWYFDASRVAGEEMDEARTRLSAMLGVEEDELSFGPSTTQNAYVLAQAFRAWLEPGDAIVVTDQDHEANSGAWRRLAEHGIDVREWKIDRDTGALDPADLAALLDGSVRLVAFPHCSNVVGQINDVAAITRIAHEAGAAVCVDGVSYAPHGLPDLGALGCDIYLFSAYKTYGPHQGLMVIRRSLGEALPNQGHFFNADSLYKRFTPAGPDHAQVAACAGIADYVDTLYAQIGSPPSEPRARAAAVHDAMRAREVALMRPLMDYLTGRNDIRLIGPRKPAHRAPTIAIRADRPGLDLAERLAAHDIAVGGGDFYAVRPLRAMGIDPEHGVLRMSLLHYNTEEEVARLVSALDAVL